MVFLLRVLLDSAAGMSWFHCVDTEFGGGGGGGLSLVYTLEQLSKEIAIVVSIGLPSAISIVRTLRIAIDNYRKRCTRKLEISARSPYGYNYLGT